MREIEYDLSKTAFNSIFNDWQLKAIEAIWASPSGVKSRVVTEKVNQSLKGRTISHTRVIHFLKDMREMGVIVGADTRGKGGGYFVYHAKLNEDGFKRCIVEKMLSCLICSFPEETREAIKRTLPF